MSISFGCRSRALLLLMTACLVCTPRESCCQTILQPMQLPMATPTPQVDEKSEAETKLRIVSAVLTKTPDGRVVGFQMGDRLLIQDGGDGDHGGFTFMRVKVKE